MRKLKCKDCHQIKLLTKHSLIGYHLPPYIWICAECHRIRHNIKLKKKYPKKYARGTKRVHKSSWRKIYKHK